MYFCISIFAAGAFLATQYTETSSGYEDENGKEIVTEDITTSHEIEWMVQEYEGTVNIEDIIQKNIQ